MPRMKVTIDGRTILDGNPTHIGKPPPELTPDQLRRGGTKLKPSQIALATVFSMYAMQGQVTGMASFDFDDSDWTLTVHNVDGVICITSTTE